MKRLSQMSVVFVSTMYKLHRMMEQLSAARASTTDWHLNVDFEGINWGDHGQICLGQFSGKGSDVVYVVDFIELDPFAAAPQLGQWLESPTILKLMFDPRSDAEALFTQRGIRLDNVLCLQLADNAFHRQINQGYKLHNVRGFSAILAHEGTVLRAISGADRKTMASTKHLAKSGSLTFDDLNRRPLDPLWVTYSAQDIYFFDELKAAWYDPLNTYWTDEVDCCSRQRVADGIEGNVGTGKARILSPLRGRSARIGKWLR